ncbi:MAG: FAD-binding oxidoreductase [Cyclobacteriaceae bacterium]|nr:FAD-binding oxidoreductase [Cyclobacteriaceae bacterium]
MIDLEIKAIEALKTQLKGEVILPSDEHYDKIRKVYNAMIDKRPAVIVKCIDVADVIHAVNFGRDNHMLVAVRGGGHSGAGLGICDDGLVIDLSGIKYVRVDSTNNTVRVGGGNTWGEVDHATHPFGLAVPSGIISTTGVGGLTLGGGSGHLSRKYGLTIDNLVEADMVLADGSFVTVNAEQNSDLFWAIRGGGGNFGIVTSFLFKAHPVHTVVGGISLWPIEDTEKIMEWYHGFINNAPDELNGFIATMMVPGPPFPENLHNKMFCGIVWCYAGDLNHSGQVFEPVKKMHPVFEHIGPMPFPALQLMFDEMMVPGMQWYWRGDFFTELSAEAAGKHLKFGSEIPTPLSQMHLYPVSGAAGRVDNSTTPWAYRDAKYSMVIVGVDPDPANTEIITRWTREYWEALHPYSSGGGYTNFLMEESGDRVKKSYRQNYDRLVEIKRRYDPENFFRVNQNIKP